jgi:hypothetical protein
MPHIIGKATKNILAKAYNKDGRRDLELPSQRQRLQTAIEQDLIHDQHVLAVFYGGSIGEGNTDIYSDIDLRIVVREEVFEEYRKNKKQRAMQWGNVLFFEDFPWTNYTIAHFDCFIKVDVFYYHPKMLHPSVWLQKIKIVYEKNGIMTDILKRSKTLSYEPTIEEIEIWRGKCFAYMHEAYRRVMRNELYYALHCVDNLRLLMAAAWYMEAGIQPNTIGDWAKIEGKRSKLADWQLFLLESWDCNRDAVKIMSVIKQMIPEFKRVHRSLCEKKKLEENEEWLDRILGMI